MRKLVALLLALCMMCSVVTAVADEERVTSISTKHFEIGHVPSSDAFNYYEEKMIWICTTFTCVRMDIGIGR